MSSGFAELPAGPRRILSVGALLCALLATLPLASLFFYGIASASADWQHALGVVLPSYLHDTILLLFGCGLLAATIGTALAWVMTAYDFPLKRVLQWLVLLPLALPGYVVAYVYVGLLSYAGPVQTWLRATMGWKAPADYLFPEIRSTSGAAIVLAFVLYPYVYLAARSAFLKQSQNQVQSARVLGKTALGAFFRVALPIAMPNLAVGILFVLLEALNDIGAAQFFGVQTLTYGVYALWLGEDNFGAAIQLALLLCVLAIMFVAAERYAHRMELKYRANARTPAFMAAKLNGWRAALALVASTIPLAIGFLIPVAKIVLDAARRTSQFYDPALWSALAHTAGLAVTVSIITICLGLILVYAQRHTATATTRALLWIGTFGYAIPGTVLAIGLLAPLGGFDRWLNQMFATGALLSGSIFGVTLALSIRFLTLSFRTLEAGARRITPNLDSAARTLGKTAYGSFQSIHLPLLRPAMFAALVMIFVDTMKELPATLLMRPFDFETLATRLFETASLSQLEDAAAPALIIVLAGMIPVYLLARQITRPDRQD